MDKVLLILVGLTCFLSYYISGWKESAVSYMNDDEKKAVLQYHYETQFLDRPEIELSEGRHEYKGFLVMNSPNRTPDLQFILQKNNDNKYYVNYKLQNKKGVITGTSSIRTDDSECNFTVRGKIEKGHIELHEKRTKDCNNNREWIDKTVGLIKGVNGGHFGGWTACAGFKESCQNAGTIYLDKVDLQKLAAEVATEKHNIESLRNSSFHGKLWYYPNHKEIDGTPINKRDGHEYDFSLKVDDLKEDGTSITVTTRISRSNESGVLIAEGVLKDGNLEISEVKEVNGNSNWFLKRYDLPMKELVTGRVSAHWVNLKDSSDGGFFVLTKGDK